MASAAASRVEAVSVGRDLKPEYLQKPLLLFFFISGIPALIYQIVWQRALFSIYGVNIESVAVVVSAFMLGLGLGSIIGGYVSRLNVSLLAIFAAAEAGTGIYGFFSLSLFHRVALHTAGAPLLETGCLAFMLLVIPTILMGSTLPILLEHCVRQLPNVGRITGLLYFANTLGSACACFLAGTFLLGSCGLSGSIRIAASINLGISLVVLAEHLRTRSRTSSTRIADTETGATRSQTEALGLSFGQALILAAAGGFIALAYEITWCRVFSFATGTNPKVFAYLLGAFLGGIAAGSLLAERLCRQLRIGRECILSVGAALFGGNLLALFVASEFANLFADMPHRYAICIGLSLVAFAAALLSMIFPLICHSAIAADENAGARLSYLYFSNIVGSSLGSLIVGFVGFEYLSLKALLLLLAALGMGLGIAVLMRAGGANNRIVGFSVLAALALAVGANRLTGVYDTLSGLSWAEVLENRHEVITVDHAGAIYGGGAYDGMFNIDPVKNTNWITRLYAALSLHPAPSEVLMVGLSSGSWAQVIVNDPRVKHLTVVEINPGYLKMIPRYPEVSSLLHNPKFELIIDDGRRWLLANPDKRYDLVVMNMSFHWRANSTNLLSQEFVQLIRGHLNPRGLYFFNTTDSADAQLTASSAFANAIRISNFIAVSDSPIRLDKTLLTQYLLDFQIDGRHVISNPALRESREQLERLSSEIDRVESGRGDGMFEYGPSLRQSLKGARVITDDNMAVEWHRSLAPHD